MIQKIIQLSFLASTLLLFVDTSVAGKLYRFPDENGVPTMSRELPPSAAQKGYDILDDQSLRLIERVPPALTAAQILELDRQQQLEEEKKQQATIAAEQAEIARQQVQKQQKQQMIHDQNLLASYDSEQDLLTARDANLQLHQTRLTESIEKQSQLDLKLRELQQQAADQELSGSVISANLQKGLDASQQEISNTSKLIEQLNEEITQLTKQYAEDLTRLRELLHVEGNIQ